MRTTTGRTTEWLTSISALTLPMAMVMAGMGCEKGDVGTSGAPGAAGATGPQGTQGAQGDPGLTPGELEGVRDVLRGGDEVVACENVDLAAPAAGQGVQYELGARFSAFYETERCKFVQVGSEGLAINRFAVKYTDGSHHALLFRTPYKELPTQNIRGEFVDTSGGRTFDCPEGAGNDWEIDGVIAGSQNPEWAPGGFGAGNALIVEPGTWLIINAHYLNPTPEGIQTCVKMNLHTIPRAQVVNEVGVIFWYNPFISVPPSSSSQATLSCPITRDITLLNAQSHMHSRGMDYSAKLYAPTTDAFVRDVFATEEWESPLPTDFSPPLVIPVGSRIEYRCGYMNGEARSVNQGLKTVDEMCMFIGFYYPRDNTLDNCGPSIGAVAAGIPKYFGAMTGRQAHDCWFSNRCATDPTRTGCRNDPDGLSNAQQDCMTGTCRSAELFDYLLCAGDEQDGCADSCQVASNMSLYQTNCAIGCGAPAYTADVAACGANQADYQARCTTTTPMAAYQTSCQQSLGATCVATPSASGGCATECAGGLAVAACTSCLTTCVTPGMTACVTGHVTACVTAAVTDCVTDRATACITPCVTGNVRSCAGECLQRVACASEFTAMDTAAGCP